MPVVSFPEPVSMGERDWGTEDLLVLSPGHYTLKRLFVKAGCKGGLQYHHLKDEAGFLVSGTMIIRYDPGDGTLVERTVNSGDAFHFPAGAVHQEEAVTDCVIIEASTPHANDRVRCEQDYGLPLEGGLPSTTPSEVRHL